MDRIDRKILEMKSRGMGTTDMAREMGLPYSDVSRRIARLMATGVLEPDWEEEEVIYVEDPHPEPEFEPEPDFVHLDAGLDKEMAGLVFKIDALMRQVVEKMRQTMEVDPDQITLRTPDGWTIERKSGENHGQ